MIKFAFAALLAFSVTSIPISHAAELEGDYLYKVSTLRAAPGQFSNLIDWLERRDETTFYLDSGDEKPMYMRHSQGDHWDLLVIAPMQGYAEYYSERRRAKRDEAFAKHGQMIAPVTDMIAFEEDVFAYGPSLEAVRAEYRDNDFFHIEMFAAAPGMVEKLFEQRQMENDYLAATGQTRNMIFRRSAGSDIDVFTIGFHKTLEAFAKPASVSDEDKEKAAKAAGFKDRADLSFYLRSLISSHHDTLAGKLN